MRVLGAGRGGQFVVGGKEGRFEGQGVVRLEALTYPKPMFLPHGLHSLPRRRARSGTSSRHVHRAYRASL
eukprot:103736-Amorphochlora_amoeboformis.AAC.1